MAITEDASSPVVVEATGQATTIVTASFSPPAGSVLVAMAAAGYGGTSNTTPSITLSDSAGGTWTSYSSGTANQGNVCVGWRPCSSAPGSITVTATYGTWSSGGGGRMIQVKVLDGADLVQSGAAHNTFFDATGTSTTSLSITTTKAGSMCYLCFDDPNNNDPATPGTGVTAYSTYSDSTDLITAVSARSTNATTTPGATTFSMGWGITVNGAAAGIEIIPSTATPTRPIRELMSLQAVKRASFY